MYLDVTPVVWQRWCLAVLVLLLVVAVDSDVRENRVPNVVVLLMLCCGVGLNVVGPANGNNGLFSDFPGALGAGTSLLGAGVGLGLFLPLYMLRAMGAGDVKLMAAMGSFVGPLETLSLGLCILVSGGLLAVFRMLWTRKSRLVFSNVRHILGRLAGGNGQRFDPKTQSVERMPYALAFAAGLLAYGYWRLKGGAPFISF